jgi:hypothetical protein
MTTINNYKTNKNYRQRQSLYNCHSKKNVRKKYKSVHTIKKTLLSTLKNNKKACYYKLHKTM